MKFEDYLAEAGKIKSRRFSHVSYDTTGFEFYLGFESNYNDDLVLNFSVQDKSDESEYITEFNSIDKFEQDALQWIKRETPAADSIDQRTIKKMADEARKNVK